MLNHTLSYSSGLKKLIYHLNGMNDEYLHQVWAFYNIEQSAFFFFFWLRCALFFIYGKKKENSGVLLGIAGRLLGLRAKDALTEAWREERISEKKREGEGEADGEARVPCPLCTCPFHLGCSNLLSHSLGFL